MKTKSFVILFVIFCSGCAVLLAQMKKKYGPSMQTGRAYHMADMTKTQMSPELQGRLFWGQNILGNIIEFPADFTPLEPHSHPHEQFVFCLAGEAEMIVGDKRFMMKKDDICYIPPDVPHGAVPSKTLGVTLMDVFSPLREDFIEKAIAQGTAGK